jgi:CRISPR-associated protein Csh1
MVFGIGEDDTFYYPGMVPAFRKYFRLKLNQNIGSDIPAVCSLCNCKSDRSVNLNKVFKFATFDKSSFLPGITSGKGIAEKVFPICNECLSYLSFGRECLDRMFLDTRTLPGIRIYVVPELVFEQRFLEKASSQTQQFIHEGLSTSEHFFHILAKQDNSLIYHFLFWEKNQAQERLHLMVEDVPPSRLSLLEELWRQSYKVFLWNSSKDPDCDFNTIDLDNALKTVYSTLISLSGKNENDQKMIQSMTIGIIGNLLNQEKVDIKRLKQLMVSRFPSLFSDDEWLRFGGYNLRKMMAVIEFLEKANRR